MERTSSGIAAPNDGARVRVTREHDGLRNACAAFALRAGCAERDQSGTLALQGLAGRCGDGCGAAAVRVGSDDGQATRCAAVEVRGAVAAALTRPARVVRCAVAANRHGILARDGKVAGGATDVRRVGVAARARIFRAVDASRVLQNDLPRIDTDGRRRFARLTLGSYRVEPATRVEVAVARSIRFVSAIRVGRVEQRVASRPHRSCDKSQPDDKRSAITH